MEKITTSVASSVLTALVLGAFSYMYYEIETYKELRETLPKVAELAKVREEMEKEYIIFKAKTNKRLDSLKNDNLKIKAQLKTDSAYIHFNNYYVRMWLGQ